MGLGSFSFIFINKLYEHFFVVGSWGFMALFWPMGLCFPSAFGSGVMLE